MEKRKSHTFFKGLAATTLLGGAALNVSLARHMVTQYQLYRDDSGKADAAEAETIKTTAATVQRDMGLINYAIDSGLLRDLPKSAAPAEKDELEDRLAEDKKRIGAATGELSDLQKEAVAEGYTSPESRVSALRKKAHDDKKEAELTALEITAIDGSIAGGLAYGTKKLLDARKNRPANAYIAKLEAREVAMERNINSCLARYEREIDDSKNTRLV